MPALPRRLGKAGRSIASRASSNRAIRDSGLADLWRKADELEITIHSQTTRYIDVVKTYAADKKIEFLPYSNIRERKYARSIVTFIATAETAATITKDAVCSKTDTVPLMSVQSRSE
jgi:hypothetical protein